MEKLKDLLLNFDGSGLTIKELGAEFERIAKSAIYGGHFRVNEEFNIYIEELEFYFHSEDDSISTVHDWAMYHRNTEKEETEYFPIGSLHPHRTGVDVTFEKPKIYRASFLIRKYKIESKTYSQPTYLREDLFGYTGCILGDGPKIRWEDNDTLDYNNYEVLKAPRINVGAYEADGNRIKGEFDSREWRFTRVK